MGEKEGQPRLRLVDDPVMGVIQMLRRLPLETAVATLETAAARAERLGLLTDADRERIDELVSRIALPRIDRAA